MQLEAFAFRVRQGNKLSVNGAPIATRGYCYNFKRYNWRVINCPPACHNQSNASAAHRGENRISGGHEITNETKLCLCSMRDTTSLPPIAPVQWLERCDPR